MANDVDLQAHENTYAGFTTMLKWATGVAFVTAFILVLVIS